MTDAPLPLTGLRVLVTRPTTREDMLAERLAALGAAVVHAPLTRIEPLEPASLDAALEHVVAGHYGWVLLTSANAVRVLVDRMDQLAMPPAMLGAARVGVVGSATAAILAAAGRAPDLVPERYDAEGLVEALGRRTDVVGSRVLHLAAHEARPVLADGLAALGAQVDVVPIYRSVADPVAARGMVDELERSGVDLVVFTAGSAVRAYAEAVGLENVSTIAGASIGPVTSMEMRALGIPVRLEAQAATVDALVDAITAAWAPRVAPR